MHLHGLENNQTSDLRLKRGVHDGKDRWVRLESGTHAPGTQEPTEGTRHPSQIPGAEHQEQPHIAEGRLRDAQPEPLVLYGQCSFPRSFCFAPQMQETNRTGGNPEYQTLADVADPRSFSPRAAHSPLSHVSLGFHFHFS